MNKILLLLLLIALMQSCVPANKLYFFYNKVPSVQQIDRAKQNSSQRIKQGDRLFVTISIPDPIQQALLNPYSNTQAVNSNLQYRGYLVDKDGNIELPILGNFPVLGLTTQELVGLIKKKLEYLYKDPFVTVYIDGKIYYMGGRGGSTISIINERLTIFEAIAQANSNDPYDMRNQLWLIREENNERIFTKLNLTDSSIFNSPYYYLRNNDLLYMKPGALSNSFASNSPLGFALSVSTTLFTIFLLIRTFF